MWTKDPELLIDDVEKDVVEKSKMAALFIHRSVKLGSPVDTGRFRNNWSLNEGTIGFGGSVNLGFSNKMPVYFISNNLPYSQKLADGYSRQAAAGWIDQIVRNAEEILK